MKKFLAWLKSPSSDFLLFILILIMLNLVAARLFFRVDLTGQKTFSLSAASKELVSSLDEPLAVNVFFSDSLPSPYNTARQYLSDLLMEYEGASRGNFSYSFYNMNNVENQRLAQDYGVSQVQIQELSDNEIGFRGAYMGLAAVYRDRIEAVSDLTSSDGMEYRLTSLFSQMVAQANVLEGLDGTIELCLYATSELSSFNIAGFDTLRDEALRAYAKLNAENMGKVSFREASPAGEEAERIARQYGLQALSWEEDGATRQAVVGLTLQNGDDFRALPVRLARGLFGGYALTGLDSLDESLSAALKSLMSRTLTVGYVTGHGEVPIAGGQDSMFGSQTLTAANFASNAADRYALVEVDLSDGAPTGIDCLIVNGPKTAFSQEELYALDQFLLSGGNLMLFVDSFQFQQAGGQAMYYGQQQQFVPVETGLNELLSSYGITVGKNYVLDLNCYEDTSMRGARGSKLYYAPIVQRQGMNRRHPISQNLSYVIFIEASEVSFEQPEKGGELTATVLASSSAESWLATEPESFLYTLTSPPPSQDELSSYSLALLVEGRFSSAFDGPLSSFEGEREEEGGESAAESGFAAAESYLAESIRPGKIFVAGTSGITTQQVIDTAGSQPVAVFLRNALDYLNGAEDFCLMRSKGMSFNTLDTRRGAAASAAAALCQYGIPVLVALFGLFAWRRRALRKKAIRAKYVQLAGANVAEAANKAEEKND